MANKRISELSSRTPSATDLMLVGDPTTGYSYKCLVSQVGGVTSVFGRTGAVTAAEGDYSLTLLSDVAITSPASGDILSYNGSTWVNSAGGFVPYTGATQNVTLGEYGMLAGWYRLDLTPTGTPTDQGTMYWDDNQKTLALIMNGTTQKVGHDQFYYVKNSTGSTIAKGTAVRFAGTDGGSGHLLITPFLADGSNPSSYFMGVTAEEITNGSFGKVQSFGRLDGIDTSSFSDGDILYASTTVAGGFQTTVPVAPNNIVQIAAVVAAANNGKLLVRPTLGSKLTSDESVKLTSVANGNVLQYNSTLSVWENVAPSSLAVSNIYTANGTLTGNRTVTMGGNTLNFTGGNVGIGTSPVVKLDVNGTIRVNAFSPSPSGFGLFMGSDGNEGAIFTYNYTTAAFLDLSLSAKVIRFSNNNSESMRIFSSRNIGINTTTDAGYKLDVNGTMRVQDNLTVSKSFNGAVTVIVQNTNAGTSAEAQFQAKNNSGYLGVLTKYNSSFSGYKIFAAHDTAIYNSNQAGDINILNDYSAGTIKLAAGASSTAHMIVYNNGNIGINTTSNAGYKLHVNGTMRVNGNVELSVDSGAYTIIGATGDTSYRLSVDGDLRVYGNIRTAQPTGGTGTGVWRLGSTATGIFTLDTTTCVEIEIGGTLYKLATVT